MSCDIAIYPTDMQQGNFLKSGDIGINLGLRRATLAFLKSTRHGDSGAAP